MRVLNAAWAAFAIARPPVSRHPSVTPQSTLCLECLGTAPRGTGCLVGNIVHSDRRLYGPKGALLNTNRVSDAEKTTLPS